MGSAVGVSSGSGSGSGLGGVVVAPDDLWKRLPRKLRRFGASAQEGEEGAMERGRGRREEWRGKKGGGEGGKGRREKEEGRRMGEVCCNW